MISLDDYFLMQLITNVSIFRDMNLCKFRNKENKKIIFLLKVHNIHIESAFSLQHAMTHQTHLDFG